MATTVFRVEKKENYTIISNYHLQDKKLSNKAKGLLTIMLSLPPSWDMTLKGLVSLSSDGVDSIRSTISELEKNGYLSRSRSRDELGRMQNTEYTIHEQPKAEQSETKKSEPEQTTDSPAQSSDGIQTYDEANILLNPASAELADALEFAKKSASKAEKSQIGKSDMDQVGKSDVDQIGLSYVGKTYIGESDTINDLSNKDTYDINDLSNQSNKNNKVSNKDKIDKDKEEAEQLAQERVQWEEIIKTNIDYDLLSDTDDNDFIEFINLVVEIIVDVITSSKPITYIKGQKFPTQTVASQMKKITSQQIEYVWNCIQHTTSGIKNIQNYVLTSLYNAVNSEGLYWTQKINHDYPEWSK